MVNAAATAKADPQKSAWLLYALGRATRVLARTFAPVGVREDADEEKERQPCTRLRTNLA